MAAHASGDRLRFQWAVELEKERKALAGMSFPTFPRGF
jgi:hypothetical protein